MLLVMLISLYTVRVVLAVLGETDYGIYNVVGGIVALFSFLSQSLASASQRYFAFEIGRKDEVKLQRVFSVTFFLYVFVVLIIFFLSESVGLWFVNHKLTIPPERMTAVNYIYQFAIASFLITILSTPYQAIIIAREQMNIYAILGISEVVIKLLFVVLLKFAPFDKLISYGSLMFINSVLIYSAYIFYSSHRYKETKIVRWWDRGFVKEMVSYLGWNVFGAFAGVMRSQGINVLINMFFNPVVNAARGIAYQISSMLTQFSTSFYTAVRPQITKYFAADDMDSTYDLVCSSSKLTYYLLLFFSTPIFFFVHIILSVWLVDIPYSTELFTRLVIIIVLIESISNPLMTLAQATGKIKLYQITVGTLLLMNLPLSWLFLKLGFSAEYTMYVAIFVAVVTLFFRIILLRRMTKFPVLLFMKVTMLPIIVTSITSFVTVYLFYKVFESDNLVVNACLLALSVLLNACIIFLVGLNNTERKLIFSFTKKIIKKIL